MDNKWKNIAEKISIIFLGSYLGAYLVITTLGKNIYYLIGGMIVPLLIIILIELEKGGNAKNKNYISNKEKSENFKKDSHKFKIVNKFISKFAVTLAITLTLTLSLIIFIDLVVYNKHPSIININIYNRDSTGISSYGWQVYICANNSCDIEIDCCESGLIPKVNLNSCV